MQSQKKRKVAIFDVDGTIFRSSLLIETVEALIVEGIFPKNTKKKYAKEYQAWKDRKGSYEAYIDKVVDVFVSNIKGVHYGEFMGVVEKVIDSEKERVYIYTRDLVKTLKKKGYYLLAISQSPKGVLDKFCKHLGFNKVYGRFYEIGATDRFTGKIVDEHLIGNKANIVKRAIEKENLTLKNSIAVGDTEGDISMLELVEKPICFNPNTGLYKWARRTGAAVVVERKDVVYKI